MAGWTFLTNHGLVLTYVGTHPECTGLEIAFAVGITERAVRRILTDLQAEGYIQTERIGRRSRYQIRMEMPLRHQNERSATVGDLLRLLQSSEGRAAASGVAGNSPRSQG